MTVNDVLAALGVVLNGIPQALLAATYGFASIPTAFGFIVGAVACLYMVLLFLFHSKQKQ